MPYAAPEAGTAEGIARLRRAPFFPAPRSVACYGSHGAPRAPLNSPERTAQKPPKTACYPSFPQCGKSFSIACVENFFHCVKVFRARVAVKIAARPILLV